MGDARLSGKEDGIFFYEKSFFKDIKVNAQCGILGLARNDNSE